MLIWTSLAATNPIGWAVLGGIAAGAAIYGEVSFGIDVYNGDKKN